MIFVENYDGDCSRMFNPTTKRVWNTRDVVFHYRMYYNSERNEIDNNLIIYTLKQKQQTPDIVEIESIPSESENEIAIENPEELWRNSRIRNPPARLIEEISTVGAGVEIQYNNTIELRPMKYEEASDDKVEWVKAVEKELKISKYSTLQRQF